MTGRVVARAARRGWRRRVALACFGPAIVVSVLAVVRPAALEPVDGAVYDAFLRVAATGAPSGRVVIVDIDEPSLNRQGQWPWPRDAMAELVDRLVALQPAAIGLDIVFAESDRLGAPRPGLRSTATDLVFAEALRGGRTVLGHVMTFVGRRDSDEPCVLHPLGLVVVEPPDVAVGRPWFRADDAVCNLPELARSAGASGFLNAVPDGDGVLRRMPLLIELDGRRYPSLALATVMTATGAASAVLRVSNAQATVLTLGDRAPIPLDGRSNLLVRFRGPRETMAYVSAADVLAGEVDAEAIRGKVVFVGTTALGTREVVSTPVDTLFAGVEVQATVADNLLAEQFLSRHELGPLPTVGLTVGLALALASAVLMAGLAWGGLAAAGLLAGQWLAVVLLVSQTGVYVSPLFPTLGVGAGMVSLLVARLTVVEGQVRDADRAVRAARVDALTGVPNRQAFDDFFADEFWKASAEQPLALFFADVDHFKRFNDRHGHLVGDQVLVVFARTLEKAVGERGRVFRIGGEEFAAVSPALASDVADTFADHLVRAVARSARVTDDLGRELSIQCSIGIATYDGTGFARPEDLLRTADRGLYAAKSAGRNRARRADPPDVDARRS